MFFNVWIEVSAKAQRGDVLSKLHVSTMPAIGAWSRGPQGRGGRAFILAFLPVKLYYYCITNLTGVMYDLNTNCRNTG